MKIFVAAALVLFLAVVQTGVAFPRLGAEASTDDGQREETLDPAGKYKLLWSKDFDTQTITFTVVVETLGYVGFGISPNGGMVGSDIVIGGVNDDGTPYFSDRYADANAEPKINDHQDYELLAHSQTETHTTLTFSRLFDTCDDQDFKIGNDTSNLIWAYGPTDKIEYHVGSRGSYSVNLLDPVMPPFDPSTGLSFKFTSDPNFEMPEVDTTYWCTVHKAPTLTEKHHIVGFEPFLPTPEALAHTHHVIVHECRHPNGDDLAPIMELLMQGEGGHCYKTSPVQSALQRYCQSYLFVWAVGGRRTIFPDHVGFPIGEGPFVDYYMFEIHYNNPHLVKGLKFETGLTMFYTADVRQYDAGTLTVGQDLGFSLMLPPKVQSFMTVGHCSHKCTTEALPSTGINVFNVLLHSHLAGRKLKIRHYRDGKELPWLSNDDNYNFDYQQNRPLREEMKLLRGDQLSNECTYETMDRTGVTLGGLASHQEMCQNFLAYYPRIESRFCGSHYPDQKIMAYLGIESLAPGGGGEPDRIVTAPPQHAGKLFSQVANELDWTAEKVAELQQMLRFEEHEGLCRGVSLPGLTTGYLDVPEEYSPPDVCRVEEDTTPAEPEPPTTQNPDETSSSDIGEPTTQEPEVTTVNGGTDGPTTTQKTEETTAGGAATMATTTTTTSISALFVLVAAFQY